MANDFLTGNEISNYLDKTYSKDSRLEDYILDDLNVGQYQQILHTLSNLEPGRNPDSYMDYADILFTIGDYEGDPYDHAEYIKQLFETKRIPEELLKLIPRIEY